jgi:plastocyanin
VGARASARAQTGDVVITVFDYGFNPDSPTISPGQTVCWTNTGSDGGVWNSGLLAPGASYRYTFNNAGIYPYHCTPIQRS